MPNPLVRQVGLRFGGTLGTGTTSLVGGLVGWFGGLKLGLWDRRMRGGGLRGAAAAFQPLLLPYSCPDSFPGFGHEGAFVERKARLVRQRQTFDIQRSRQLDNMLARAAGLAVVHSVDTKLLGTGTAGVEGQLEA